jgi:hypothetical protein
MVEIAVRAWGWCRRWCVACRTVHLISFFLLILSFFSYPRSVPHAWTLAIDCQPWQLRVRALERSGYTYDSLAGLDYLRSPQKRLTWPQFTVCNLFSTSTKSSFPHDSLVLASPHLGFPTLTSPFLWPSTPMAAPTRQVPRSSLHSTP